MNGLLKLGGIVLALCLLFVIQGASPKDGQASHLLATVGIDAVSSGNSGSSLATVDECGAAPVGAITTIDVYIGDDPNFVNDTDVHNLGTFAATLIYNPVLMKVTGMQAAELFMDEPLFVSSNEFPDADGQFDFVIIDLLSPGADGTGVVARISLEMTGIGFGDLDLANITLFDGGEFPLIFTPSPQSPIKAEIAAGGLGNCNDFDSDGWCDPFLPSTTKHPCSLGLNDNCPAIANSNQTNTDAGLEVGVIAGDVCDPDDDGDGYWDVYESFRGSGPLIILSTPEVCDGNDNDLDGQVDEGHPDTVPGGVKDCLDPSLDTDGDGLNNVVDPDDDNDTFTDAAERVISTNTLRRCASPTFTNTFPPDVDYAATLTIVDAQDLVAQLPSLFTTTGMLNFDRRKDVLVDNVVDLQDLVAQVIWLFTKC